MHWNNAGLIAVCILTQWTESTEVLSIVAGNKHYSGLKMENNTAISNEWFYIIPDTLIMFNTLRFSVASFMNARPSK